MSLSLEMTKTGKPDSHWAGVMTLYAQGKYKFSTGQRPGGRRWRAVIQRINACPLTPVFNQTPRKYDIFGKKINCECGYHEVGGIIQQLSYMECFICFRFDNRHPMNCNIPGHSQSDFSIQ